VRVSASQLEGCVSNSQTLSDSPWCSLGKIVSLNYPSKKHISGAGTPLIAVAKIIKKNISWHISCYFVMLGGIFSITAISCNLVIRWAYQQILVCKNNFSQFQFQYKGWFTLGPSKAKPSWAWESVYTRNNIYAWLHRLPCERSSTCCPRLSWLLGVNKLVYVMVGRCNKKSNCYCGTGT